MNSVIRSRAGLSYDQVDSYLQGDAAALDSVVPREDVGAVKEMIRCSIKSSIRRNSRERGSVDLESVERVVLTRIFLGCCVGARAHQTTGLIEEAMLAAQ